MEPQKRICTLEGDSGLDRLSEMPDQVIVHILSFMPTRDAVRTMLLRRFGSLWTFVRALRFDFSEYYVTRDLSDDDEEQPIMEAAIARFGCFVRNVLMLHKKYTIDLFYLNFLKLVLLEGTNVDPCIINDARFWLRFAIDREVKHLCLVYCYLDDLPLPWCVFRSQSLVKLQLYGCTLKEYEHQFQPHMGSLRKLKLAGVHGSDEAFNQLISACPELQELDIYRPHGFRNLKITAPSVRRLNLIISDRYPFTLSCPHLKRLDIEVSGNSPSFLLDVIDVSSLEVVCVERLPEGLSSIKAFWKQFLDVDILKLSSQAFEQLCRLEKMDLPQNRWTGLGLWPRWDHERCVEVIIELLKSSVNLYALLIFDGQSSGNTEVLFSEMSTSCILPLLTSVKINIYTKYCKKFEVVEFILKNAVILEELVIGTEDDQLSVVEMLGFLKQVSRFKRASVNAIVDIE